MLITAGADSSIRLWPLDKALGLGSKSSLMQHASWQALCCMSREASIDEIPFLATEQERVGYIPVELVPSFRVFAWWQMPEDLAAWQNGQFVECSSVLTPVHVRSPEAQGKCLSSDHKAYKACLHT